ncbi:MAG TPA: OmpA family protein [Gemmatimonadales bacterium]|jgi:outer membrane protein OmpA-like peptidoglycan-associated protein|nr:OmpA family protein [Gemmatimonadales bacterium]
MRLGTGTVRLAFLVTTATLIGLDGCATKSQTGAVVGAAGGAVVGAVVGKAAGSTAKGAIIGAVVGGAAGAIIGHEMDKQANELKQNIKGARVERVGEGIQITFESGLLYDFDSDVVRPAAQVNLRELASSLDKYPGSDLLIVGHTDQVGSAGYNQSLSERRASAAANYLVSQGVRRARMSTRGMGETEPVASNETEAGRQQNRRVEVAIYASEAYRAEVARRAQP